MNTKENDIVVTIDCITYNHEKYIRDAIEGFLMQKTTFPIEIIIHDDASTDGTADIVREYAGRFSGLIRPIYQSQNQLSKGVNPSPTFVFPQARGKYIAFCEGDDYWTDPYKLQKQVDFLERNKEYSLCCGGFESINVTTGERTVTNKHSSLRELPGFSFGFNEMLNSWLTKTLTVVCRKDDLPDFNAINYRYFRDVHLFYHCIKRGKGFYFNQVFGIYRIHPGGIHSVINKEVFMNSEYRIYKELFEVNKDDFSRRKYYRTTLYLFNYNLYHSYEGNVLSSKVSLYLRALLLVWKTKEFKLLLTCFISRDAKVFLKRVLRYGKRSITA